MNPPALMHGTDWTGQDLSGWWLSEKLKGWRCVWTGTRYLNRQGTVLAMPQSWLDGMPERPLDGELYAGRHPTASVVAQAVARQDWHLLRLCVWDTPEYGLSFEQAQYLITSLKLPPHVEIIRQTCVASTAQAQTIMRGLCERGAEGVMLRRPASPYQPGRGEDLLKLKP